MVSDVVGRRIDEVVTAASQIFIDSYVYPLLLEKSNAEEIQINFTSLMGEKLQLPVIANIEMRSDGTTVWTFMCCENRDKLYEELISARDSLSEQANKLNTLNEQIQSERDDLEVFCHSLSHDFKAPIQRIQQLVTFAMEDLQSKDIAIDDELKMLKQSISNTAALMTLISGLVEYLTAGAKAPIDEVVDLNEIVGVAINLCEEDEPLNITVDMLPTVIGNTAQLQIIFKNLIANSIKYNQRTPEIAIHCCMTSREGYATLSITDNGIGMSTEYLERIFEPFSRLHVATEYGGSGLGLSIVKKLLSNQKGNMSVKSTLGEWSTFYIELTLP
jgi:two-component system sensor histidine kinase/response regulator